MSERRGVFSLPFDLLAALSDPLVWRDTASWGLMRRGETAPDWAFGLYAGGGWVPTASVSPPLEERPYVAVALRGDRPDPGAEWLRALGEMADRLQRRLVFVAQVSDDDALARRLAQELGGDVVVWQHEDHRAQEELVRACYGKAAALVSDRLHGLVMAATEGAVPLGWTDRSTRKIAVHMDLVGAPWSSVAHAHDAVPALDGLGEASLETFRVRTDDVVREARVAVHRVAGRLLGGRPPAHDAG